LPGATAASLSFPSPQKWSKGKNKEKVNNQVLFDKVRKATHGGAPPVFA
jgi:hypothetical protein